MSKIENLKKDLHALASSHQAALLQRFFKTSPGEYGEGDIFLGIKVPVQRIIVKKYRDLPLVDVLDFLQSQIHEQRMVALLILVEKFKRGKDNEKEQIFKAYLGNTKWINNWDLVDVTCHHIVGQYLADKDRGVLYDLAKSTDLWQKRIAVVSTFAFIRNNDFYDILKIAEILVNDKHDLIQKAVGWMLREVGKRDQMVEEVFLKKYYQTMPRTMLRYAIEKFSESERRFYLGKK
ncbi:DNA alkylation repair protein [Candidatus Parcubacteria bacterium]|nr:DNA alkylation repair protein [Patescibacteria group bacterium]MBU4309398.1 DNA alkylation repair protein [Patescibacteria group bacterium]MBU4431747.1 DNA alkylation repair protein [Patescibacteria group bacterium]MBU4577759.1 DNA alkylation repair protein [Patescibacteria group bacterium]MCG2697444.1 DNA alkylation repair protein [Candidatus Parcubacteria bacterium]